MHLSIFSFKKGLHAVISIVCIALLGIIGLLQCLKATWCPKENMFYFYQLEDNSLDVINIGSSHVYCSINTPEMYRQKGITAYNLAAGSQPVWFSYYYLKEAFKTQNPQVVVLDVYTVNVLQDEEFSAKTQMNILAMKPSADKLEAIRISGSDDKWNIFWGFPKTHIRYRELTAEEYSDDVCRSMMGYTYMPSDEEKENAEVLDASTVEDIFPISEKAEIYLRKCIELCKEKGVEIVLVNAPCANVTREDECRYNYVGQVASEYGVDFIDGNRIFNQIGIDYRIDNAKDGHLSYTGSLKWTQYLLDYLEEHFDLSDHRGEQKVWEDSVAVLDNLLAKEHLKQINTSDEYFIYLTEETNLPYVVIVNLKEGLGEKSALQTFGLQLGGEDERGYIIRFEDGKTKVENDIYSDKVMYSKIYNDLLHHSDRKGSFHNIIMQYTKEIADSQSSYGVCYAVFDPYSYQLMDIVEFRTEDGYCRKK